MPFCYLVDIIIKCAATLQMSTISPSLQLTIIIQFHCSWKVAKNLFIRIYSKELKLKTIAVRMEIQENPDIILKNLLTEFIRNDKKTTLIELLK